MSDEDTVAVPHQSTTLTSRLFLLDKELHQSRLNDLRKYIGIYEFEDVDAIGISQEARSDLASKISNISSLNNMRQHFLRYTQLSDLLFKVLTENRRIGQGSPLAQNISALLTEQKAVVMQINHIHKEVSKLIDETFGKLEELKRLNGEQLKIEKKIKRRTKPIESNTQSQSILSKIEKKKERLEAISFLGRRLIFASKIDWSEDPEIKELLLLFSEPVPE